MTTPQHIASLPGSARLDELKRLARRLRLLDPDLALTLGINRETVRLYLCGKSAIPNTVLITLAALDTLPREAAEAFIQRAPRKESIADLRAARRLAEHARPQRPRRNSRRYSPLARPSRHSAQGPHDEPTSQYTLGGMAPPFARCPDCGLTNNEHAANCPLDPYGYHQGLASRTPAEQFAADREKLQTLAVLSVLQDNTKNNALMAALQHAQANPVEHPASDPINPNHYRAHPSGVECIQITEHMGFNLGNAVKYVWRADLKHESPLADLRKAVWYIEREIALREREGA